MSWLLLIAISLIGTLLEGSRLVGTLTLDLTNETSLFALGSSWSLSFGSTAISWCSGDDPSLDCMGLWIGNFPDGNNLLCSPATTDFLSSCIALDEDLVATLTDLVLSATPQRILI